MAGKKKTAGAPPAGESAAPSSSPQEEPKRPAKDPVQELFDLLSEDGDDPDVQVRRSAAAVRTLERVTAKHTIANDYNVMILHDEGSLVRSDADRIYSAIRELPEQRDILLVLYSSGGEVEPAFLISQLCRESAVDRFIVAVPRIAKSAATLICCGADEIHMGPMSELGPIDPQIGNHPALGLGSALRHIAALVAEYPQSASMFAEYMARTVRPIDLGYYERVVESAAQYAEQLLLTHEHNLAVTPDDIAHKLVYGYKDHGFVIDRIEARRTFGEDVVKSDTEEYRLANAVYEHLAFLKLLAGIGSLNMFWVGSLTKGCHFFSVPTA